MKMHSLFVKPVVILAMLCMMETLVPFLTFSVSHADPTSTVGHWKLDETSGTVASDSSGNNLNGTLVNGPVWTAGKVGNSLDFDGANDEVDLGTPAELQLTGAMSLAAWIYVDSFSGDGRIISKENGSSSRSWSLNVNSAGKGVFQIATSASTSITVETASTLPVGEWVHLAGVFEPGAALRIYVNGALSNSNLSSIPSTQYNNSSHVFIGRRPDYSNAFNGKIDEVYAFSQALTGTDIAALAMEQPSALGYWKLDETSGTVASDSSGNNLNGTLVNGPVWTAGKIGNSLDFDGANDEVDLGTPAELQLTGAMSMAAWIYVDSFTGDGRIISKENGSSSRSWSLNVNSAGKGVFQIATSASTSITVETASTLPVGEWVHLAGVFEPGAALRIYVNGALSNSNLSSIPSTQYNNSSHVFIGRRPDYSNAFNGKIDEVYAFNQALTGTDIAALAGNQGTSPQISLVPSFESISVYLPGEGAGSSVQLYYRQSGTSTWKSAYAPVYDAAMNQFRGSIVKLAENTSYDVKAEVYSGGALVRTETGTVKTWTSNPVIAQTISLSSIYSGGALQINNKVGSDTGWIKIVNDTGLVIDGQKLANAAVTVTNSKYLILENFIVKGGSLHGIMLDATDSNIRIANADISGWGREVAATTETGALGQPLDSNGNEINHDAGIDIQDGYNIVVERSYIHDANGWANSWDGVTMGGQSYSNTHPQGPNAVFLRGKGGLVLRYNDFIGSDGHRYNDVVESYYNGDQNGGPYKDADVYGNFFGFGNDDTMEFDGGQMNVRFYNNRYEQTYCGLSIIPNLRGPSYVFNNLGTNLGDIQRSGTGAVVKGGGDASLGLGWSFLFNNTFYTKTNGFATYAYNSQRDMNAVTRNNIIISTHPLTSGIYNIRDDVQRAGNSFDYDALGNTTISNGSGRIYAAAGNEAHAQWGLAALTDPASGLYTLKSTAGANEVNVIDEGTPINNFADSFAGTAPDIGALEYGDSGLMPKRPVTLTSNKYMVTVPHASNTATFTISPGTYSGAYAIKKSASDDWYTVSPASGTFTAGNNVTFTITVDRSKASFDQSSEFSTLFVRLPNGLSVPVSVTALQ